jgi:ferritin-like metal-binding protein YciE
MKANTLDEVLHHELSDLYDAEQQILGALPKLIDAASSSELRQALKAHRRQTEEHVSRLEQVFEILEEEPGGEKCKGMAGLIKEGEDAAKAEGGGPAKDAALIAAAQRIEHYEIAGYGCARTHAKLLGNLAAAELLQTTLAEEGHADEKLTHLAEYQINVEALDQASMSA